MTYMTDYRALVGTKTVAEILSCYPVAKDFLFDLNLEDLPKNQTMTDAIAQMNEKRMAEQEISQDNIADQFALFLEKMLADDGPKEKLRSITILGGLNKFGNAEDLSLTIHTGQIISIVGPTGSGKSRLLNDIECIAQRDTPTKRQILINGRALSDEERFSIDSKLVAQLSQNMNFVMDLSVEEFLQMHAKSRLRKDSDSVVKRCFMCANELSGEKFTLQTKVTQLSGGQSRALMIADTAHLSASPIVLIDEIENAGIDWKRAVSLLASKEKIVLISTHDSLLALSADKRIVIQNGGIYKIIETSIEEHESLMHIEALTNVLTSIRNRLRKGEVIVLDDFRKEVVGGWIQEDEALAIVR